MTSYRLLSAAPHSRSGVRSDSCPSTGASLKSPPSVGEPPVDFNPGPDAASGLKLKSDNAHRCASEPALTRGAVAEYETSSQVPVADLFFTSGMEDRSRFQLAFRYRRRVFVRPHRGGADPFRIRGDSDDRIFALGIGESDLPPPRFHWTGGDSVVRASGDQNTDRSAASCDA